MEPITERILYYDADTGAWLETDLVSEKLEDEEESENDEDEQPRTDVGRIHPVQRRTRQLHPGTSS